MDSTTTLLVQANGDNGDGEFRDYKPVRCAFSDRKSTLEDAIGSSEHACDQWHSSRKFSPLTGFHCNFRPNTEGECVSRLQAPVLHWVREWVFFADVSRTAVLVCLL
jgi:hypothetical protein